MSSSVVTSHPPISDVMPLALTAVRYAILWRSSHLVGEQWVFSAVECRMINHVIEYNFPPCIFINVVDTLKLSLLALETCKFFQYNTV